MQGGEDAFFWLVLIYEVFNKVMWGGSVFDLVIIVQRSLERQLSRIFVEKKKRVSGLCRFASTGTSRRILFFPVFFEDKTAIFVLFGGR